MKIYSEQAIRNFVSGKGSVMTEEGKRKAKKELSNKATLLLTLLTYFFFTISNAIQLSDINEIDFCYPNGSYCNMATGIGVLF